MMPRGAARVVLAYDGRLVSTAAIAWIVEAFGAEVVCLTLDVGQKRDLLQIRDRALAAGAIRAHVVDARHALALGHILPVLQADALDRDGQPIVEALDRPLLAEKLVEVAELESATAVAHGAVEPAALDRSIRTLAPALDIIVPAREWNMTAQDVLAYARARGIGAAVESGNTHENLWGRVITAPGHDNHAGSAAAQAAPEWPPGDAPGGPAEVELAFDRGVPMSVNAVAMPLVDLMDSLETIAAAHGVGRVVSGAADGSNRRTVVEAPAAVVLHLAHRELAKAVLPPELVRLSRPLGAAYARLLSEGLWHSPTRAAIDAFVASAQQHVTGSVHLRLLNGGCSVVAIDAAPARNAPDAEAGSFSRSAQNPAAPAAVEP
jgi:argininosuccinate synthase